MKQTLTSLLLCVLISACSGERAPEPSQPGAAPYLVAVNNPLQYFAQRLLGVEPPVLLPVPAQGDPARWLPTVDDILQLQGAELVLLNGAGYSGWLDKTSLAPGRLVVTAEPARAQWIELENTVTHSHGPQGEHAHGGFAFTTWMDFALAAQQAQAVGNALVAHWPQREARIRADLESLLADLEALDQGFTAVAARLRGRQMIYSHPVYQYFERRYGLSGSSLHWEPDAMPTQSQWQALQRLARPGSLFVWEAPPQADIAERMDALGIDWVVLDPGANAGELDWLALQRRNLAALEQRAAQGEP